MLATAPLTFDVSVMEEFIPLTSGKTVALASNTEILNPLLMRDFILRYGVDAMCGFSLLFLGINYFAVSFFTALNNGLVSGLISFALMLAFPIATVTILPVFFGIDGIWASLPVTGGLGFLCSLAAFIWGKKKYAY